MTSTAMTVLLVVAVLILAALLARQRRTPSDVEEDCELSRVREDGVGLDLAARIFDPADYYWIRDTIRFPQLAETLLHHRRELALRWLRGLRSSFNELVRSHKFSEVAPDVEDRSSWSTLFLTLRFHLLIAYAQMVVYFFGPYHPIVPSLGWLLSFVRDQFRAATARIVEVDGARN